MTKSRTTPTSRAFQDAMALGWMAWAIPGATFVTLAHRLPMLAQAFVDPKALSNPELYQMVDEKLKAALQSMRAVERGAAASNRLLNRGTQANQRLARDVTQALLGSEVARQRIVRRGPLSVALFNTIVADMTHLGIKTTRGALAPAHRKVVANARRLSRAHSGAAQPDQSAIGGR